LYKGKRRRKELPLFSDRKKKGAKIKGEEKRGKKRAARCISFNLPGEKRGKKKGKNLSLPVREKGGEGNEGRGQKKRERERGKQSSITLSSHEEKKE